MSLWKIAFRNIQHRVLASGLTAFSMALGVGLVVTVLVIHGVIDKSFRRSAQGYDLIVGAKGSRLELVLNTVYHLSEPIGTISYDHYLDLEEGRFSPEVELAIPVCMGGNYEGYRVVGTTPDMFDELEYRGGEKYKFAEGRNFGFGSFFEGVIGATVAKKTGLKVGDPFRPVHGLDAQQGEKHDPFTVAGILAPTGTPNDRALFINIEGFFLVHDHDEKQQEEDRQVTAVLVCTNRDRMTGAIALPKLINKEPDIQAVAPTKEITRLFEGIVGNIQLVLLVLAVLVVVVAGVGMMVSIYNSMNDRRHDIAIMRALGARRRTVMAIILLESILLSIGGGLAGLVMGHGLIGVLGPAIAEHTGVIVHAWQFQLNEMILIPGLIVLASVVGYMPAVVAYRTDVARSLAGTP